MANHGYITAKNNLSKEQVLLDLQEINQRRFNGLLKIATSINGKNWLIYFGEEKDKYINGIDFWLSSEKVIEHRHEIYFLYYVEIVFAAELGKKYDAILSDDGLDETWEPNPKKYPTYKSWLEIKYNSNYFTKNSELAKECIEGELNLAPKELREY